MVIWEDKVAEYREAQHVAKVLRAEGDLPSELYGDDQKHKLGRKRLRDTYHALAAVEKLSTDDDILRVLRQAKSRDKKGAPKHLFKAVGWAVPMIVVLAVGLLMGPFDLVLNKSDSGEVVRYVTRVGEQKEVMLDDGSRIMLNTGSEMLVLLSDRERNITLKRGEAFFKVARDPDRVFKVEVGDRVVSVLGTSFNVLKWRDGIDLSVQEGLVAFHAADDELGAGVKLVSESVEEAIKYGGQWKVGAGWMLSFDTKTGLLNTDQVDEVAPWRTGMLNFIGRPLVDVVKELNRYSAKKILIEDASIVETQVSASIRVDGVLPALRVIGDAYGLDVRESFDHISIFSQ